jgi:hypothetical protein
MRTWTMKNEVVDKLNAFDVGVETNGEGELAG